MFPHSDWLVLVHAARQTETQSHSNVLMENRNLHIVIVLQIENAERTLFVLCMPDFVVCTLHGKSNLIHGNDKIVGSKPQKSY